MTYEGTWPTKGRGRGARAGDAAPTGGDVADGGDVGDVADGGDVGDVADGGAAEGT